MPNLLVINSSVSGEASVSRTLVRQAVARLTSGPTGATVVERDLGANPVPHLTDATVAGVRGVPAAEAEHRARALSDELIGELRAADVIVIGAPMYNFGLPTGRRFCERPTLWGCTGSRDGWALVILRCGKSQ